MADQMRERGHGHDAQSARGEHGGHGAAVSSTDSQISVGILTASDRGARGERADVSGPTIHNLVVDRLGAKVAQYKVVPDDRSAIEATLIEWADERRLDLVLTTGGTGFSARDITPEATKAVVDRETPALVQAMLFESLRVTPYAMLTRATAGIRKRTLIVNLPGNPKAVTENFEAIAEVLPHAVDIIRGVDTHTGGAHAGHDRHAGHAGHREGAAAAQESHGAHQEPAGHAEHERDAGHAQHAGHREHREHETRAESPTAATAASTAPATAPAARGGIAKNVGGPPC